MADQRMSLALSFIEGHPNSAARILEQHDLGTVARFITELPEALAVTLLQRMLPQYVSRLSRSLEVEQFIHLLNSMELSFSAAVLRHLPNGDRQRILARLPANRRAACTLLLSFTQDTVGAWLTPLVVTVPDDASISEALNFVRAAGEVVHSNYIFVVDRDRRLRGRISYVDMLRAEPGLSVDALMFTRCNHLLGRMSLQKAAEHTDWQTVDVMPVNNRNQQFIGVLRYVDLRLGLERMNTDAGKTGRIDPVTGIFEVYGNTLLALFNSLGDVIESDQRQP
ncbi:MAG: hypothetical protein RLZZ385_1613 [Pseudomonadota bacterium]|jgi:magnesium transporter